MTWLNNGQSIKVPVGNYRIFFKELEGFQTPSPIVVGVIKNQTTNVDVEYVSVVNGPWGDRGVFGGDTTYTSLIDYITISTTGNATIFGYLIEAKRYLTASSNNVYGVFGGGYTNTYISLIEYITISTTGNSTFFGNLTIARATLAACSNETYIVFGGGYIAYGYLQSIIDYITISTTGNAITFGNLTNSRGNLAACSNTERGVFSTNSSLMDYISIYTTSNAIIFGQLTSNRCDLASCSGN